MDGATSVQTLRRVFPPLVLPGIVTVSLFAFITSSNEFIATLVFMSNEASFTLPVMLTGVSTGVFGVGKWGTLQAGVVVSIIPGIGIYLLLQRYYVAGLLGGAVKQDPWTSCSPRSRPRTSRATLSLPRPRSATWHGWRR